MVSEVISEVLQLSKPNHKRETLRLRSVPCGLVIRTRRDGLYFVVHAVRRRQNPAASIDANTGVMLGRPRRDGGCYQIRCSPGFAAVALGRPDRVEQRVAVTHKERDGWYRTRDVRIGHRLHRTAETGLAGGQRSTTRGYAERKGYASIRRTGVDIEQHRETHL